MVFWCPANPEFVLAFAGLTWAATLSADDRGCGRQLGVQRGFLDRWRRGYRASCTEPQHSLHSGSRAAVQPLIDLALILGKHALDCCQPRARVEPRKDRQRQPVLVDDTLDRTILKVQAGGPGLPLPPFPAIRRRLSGIVGGEPAGSQRRQVPAHHQLLG